jgi:hypothetical protein
MSRRHPVVHLALWAAFLAVTLRLLHGSTMGTLSVPADSPETLTAWVDRTSPAVMAVSVVRLVALVGAWYLVAVTVATVVADVAGWRRLARIVAAVSPPVVRRIATRSAGAGLVAGAFVAGVPLPAPLDTAPPLSPPSSLAIRPAGATPSTTPPPAATMTATPEAEPQGTAVQGASAIRTATMTRERSTAAFPPPAQPRATATMTYFNGTPPAGDHQAARPVTPEATRRPGTAAGRQPPTNEDVTASMTRADDGDPSRHPGQSVSPPVPRERANDRPTPAPPSPRANAHPAADDAQEGPWVVGAGDSFWSVAEETLRDRSGGQAPTEARVERYWRVLVDANRGRMADPGNPDLLIPGQELVLPSG